MNDVIFIPFNIIGGGGFGDIGDCDFEGG